MVKKTTGDKTGMDCTQWIVTDHQLTRGASEDQWYDPYIVTAARSVYRTVHLRIYEAYQKSMAIKPQFSHNSLQWLRLAYSTTGSYDNLHDNYVF